MRVPPHARGSAPILSDGENHTRGSPARAEICPAHGVPACRCHRFPRTRGDLPVRFATTGRCDFPAHAGICLWLIVWPSPVDSFPVHAGICLGWTHRAFRTWQLPCIRVDLPLPVVGVHRLGLFSRIRGDLPHAITAARFALAPHTRASAGFLSGTRLSLAICWDLPPPYAVRGEGFYPHARGSSVSDQNRCQ